MGDSGGLEGGRWGLDLEGPCGLSVKMLRIFSCW